MTRVAFVHEWLNTYGGAERVLAEAFQLFPHAELFALIHYPQNLRGTPLADRRVRTSFLQNIPSVEHLYRGLLPIMPAAIESLDLRGFDLVISFSHAVAHGARTTRGQRHVSYISSPMRYAWHLESDYLRLHHLDGRILGPLARFTLSRLRAWDKRAAARGAELIANSQWTSSRIDDAWQRQAKVIYPPVHVERFVPSAPREDFYLCVSRLVPYKMISEIVRAFNEMQLPLVIAGDGPEYARLKNLASDNIRLLGRQSDEAIAALMSRARGFVYMAVEDFGIAMAEAQAAGCPVIALGRGGAAEIVLNEHTGVLFDQQSVDCLIEAVMKSRSMTFDAGAIRFNAMRFASERFREEFSAFLSS